MREVLKGMATAQSTNAEVGIAPQDLREDAQCPALIPSGNSSAMETTRNNKQSPDHKRKWRNSLS